MTSHAGSAGTLTRAATKAQRASARPIRPPRPILLFLVYGVFLVIVGVTATAQVMLASVHVSTSALNQAVGTDTQVVRGFVDDLLTPADLTATSISRRSRGGPRGRPPHVHHPARDHPRGDPAPRRPDPRQRRPAGRASPPRTRRIGGRRWPGSRRSRSCPRPRARPGPATSARDSTLREFLPLLQDGRVVGVVGVWRDAAPIVAAIDAARRDIVVVTVTRGDRRGRRAVPGLPLGAGPDHPPDDRRSSRPRAATRSPGCSTTARSSRRSGRRSSGSAGSGGGLEIAILDIDNFRILNDTWGHGVGDQAILAVDTAPAAGADEPASAATGRTSSSSRSRAAPWAPCSTRPGTCRSALVSVRLSFGDGNDLPVTVSGAVRATPRTARRSRSSSPTPRSRSGRRRRAAAMRSCGRVRGRSVASPARSTCSRA